VRCGNQNKMDDTKTYTVTINTGNATAISAIGEKTLITRYQASRELHDVTSAQLSIVVWKMLTFSEERFVGVSEAETSTDIDHSYP